MTNKVRLPLIVGFGGYNAAGRSSGHNAYKRMVFESLGVTQKRAVVQSLASIMKLVEFDGAKGFRAGQELTDHAFAELIPEVLNGTLVRRIENNLFAVDAVPVGRQCTLAASEESPVVIRMAARDVPESLPFGWTIKGESAGQVSIEIWKDYAVNSEVNQPMPVQAAGQLPTGFDPGSYYRSAHHPRGLQLNILAASDALHSMGIAWSEVLQKIAPDQVGVYSSSVMSQLDGTGIGGMMQARTKGNRTTSKQLALGLNSMPADFVNAYVLGSVGVTGAVTGACATFLYNLRAGVEDIQSGRRRVVVVGSSEAPVLPEVIEGYAAMSALATDADLRKLTGQQDIDYRRASRPFGENCGFTLAESGQYVVLMDDALALELGASIYGAVPGVFVHADGYKKSISAPGPGNYVTMGKAVALARAILGDESVRHHSFVQAHGSSTPQNRLTESRIFDRIAETFGIESWPVAAVKAYLGHSLGPASGDQLAASLGVFAHGFLPGIKTIDEVADDVFQKRLNISRSDIELGVENTQIAFLNSKGFGGNNATATVLSPRVTENILQRRYRGSAWAAYQHRRELVQHEVDAYELSASRGILDPIYEFGSRAIDENDIVISCEQMQIPGFNQAISLEPADEWKNL